MSELIKLLGYLSDSFKKIIITFLLCRYISLPKYINLNIIKQLNLEFDDKLIQFNDLNYNEFFTYVSYIKKPNIIYLLTRICKDKNYILYKEVLLSIPNVLNSIDTEMKNSLYSGLHSICNFGTIKFIHKYVKHFINCQLNYSIGLEGMCQNTNFFEEGLDKYISLGSTSQKKYPIDLNILWGAGLAGAYRINNLKIINLIITKIKSLEQKIDWDYALLGIFTSIDLASRFDMVKFIINLYDDKNTINWDWICSNTCVYCFPNSKLLLQFLIDEYDGNISGIISIDTLNKNLMKAYSQGFGDIAELLLNINPILHGLNYHN